MIMQCFVQNWTYITKGFFCYGGQGGDGSFLGLISQLWFIIVWTVRDFFCLLVFYQVCLLIPYPDTIMSKLLKSKRQCNYNYYRNMLSYLNMQSLFLLYMAKRKDASTDIWQGLLLQALSSALTITIIKVATALTWLNTEQYNCHFLTTLGRWASDDI